MGTPTAEDMETLRREIAPEKRLEAFERFEEVAFGKSRDEIAAGVMFGREDGGDQNIFEVIRRMADMPKGGGTCK